VKYFFAMLDRILLIVSLLWVSWLGMMLVHEGGHVLGAISSGGVVQRVIWHPLVLSRTDVSPNPHPLIEVWAWPIVGCVVPGIAAGLAWLVRLKTAYLVTAFAGFCWLANGAYLGCGVIDPIGDAKQLVALGVPRWVLAVFGFIIVAAGLWMWDRVSGRFGFGRNAAAVDGRHAKWVAALTVVLTLAASLLGNRGI